jgi:ribulose-phosphate 3-epimerase
MGILHPEILKLLSFWIYRYRFLMYYVLIGTSSIFLEILTYRGLETIGIFPPLSNLAGLLAGVFFAFWLNVRYNFKVPKGKRNRSLLYFISISFLSVLINFIFKKQIEKYGFSYGEARFLSAGSLFAISYLFHRKYSFCDYKKVSVAIYANGIEDIGSIHQRVGRFPDIIHVDIIDHTFGNTLHEPRAYKLEVKKAYWPNKPLHVHLMSKTPSIWISEIAKYTDLIIFHVECEEDIKETIDKIKKSGCKVGLALMMDTAVDVAKPYMRDVDTLMLLTINKPGYSGQKFDARAMEKIEQINSWPERSNFNVCIDGGVNEFNIGLLNVEIVVSGSSVLSHANPPQQIMRLQTSSNYENI